MSVRYKFKNSLAHYETISFVGNSISVGDFKNAVFQQKYLSKADDDLKVVNADTKREYKNADDRIPKNISLIVSRVPRTPQSKKPLIDKRTLAAKSRDIGDVNKAQNVVVEPLAEAIVDLSKLNISEENKIPLMIGQSTSVYNPNIYQTIHDAAGQVPSDYMCHQCYLTGHWVEDCPLVFINKPKTTENQRRAGIPNMYLQSERVRENKENKLYGPLVIETKAMDVPEDLLCPICKEIFVDAVMTSCCGNSFCDVCVRSALLESAYNMCPACREKDILPDSLMPSRFLRKSVQSFRDKSALAAYANYDAQTRGGRGYDDV